MLWYLHIFYNFPSLCGQGMQAAGQSQIMKWQNQNERTTRIFFPDSSKSEWKGTCSWKSWIPLLKRANRRGWHLSGLSAIKSHKLILVSTGIAYDERVADNRKALNFQEYWSQINIHNFQQIISEGGLRELHN